MRANLRQDGLIHRRAMLRPNSAQCGAIAPEYGHLNLSNSGVGVTCEACNPPQRSAEELRALQMASIEAAATRHRASIAT